MKSYAQLKYAVKAPHCMYSCTTCGVLGIKQLMGGHPIYLIYPICSIGFIVEISCCVCRSESIL